MPTALAVFVATLPLVFLPGNDDPSSLPQAVWLQVGTAFLWLVGLMGSRQFRTSVVSRILAPGTAVLAWLALSMFWATDLYASQRTLLRWGTAFGLTVLIAVTVESLSQARGLLLSVFWSSVAVSVVGLLQYFWGFDLVPQSYPPGGTLGNRNVAAEFVVAGAVSGALGLFLPIGTVQLFSLMAGSAVALAFVLHSDCRGAWVALIVQWVGITALLPSGRLVPRWTFVRALAVMFGASIFAALATIETTMARTDRPGAEQLLTGATRPLARLLEGAPPAPDDPTQPAASVRAERSVSIRLGVWRNTIEMIRSAPVAGVGIGNFQVHYPRFATEAGGDGTRKDERVDAAHNDYLQLIAEAGVIGVVLSGWFLMVVVRAAWAVMKGPGDEAARIVVFSLLGLTGLFAAAFVSPLANQPAALAAASVFVGVILSCAAREGRLASASSDRDPGPWLRSTGVAGAAAVLVILLTTGLAEIRADRHVLKMAQAEALQDWPAVIREGLQVRHLNPGRVDPRFATASAMIRMGRVSGGVRLLEEFIAVEPHNANALGNLGIAHMTRGDLEAASRYLNRLLVLRPDDAVALGLLDRIRSLPGSAEQGGLR